jgi:hypothetical protein
MRGERVRDTWYEVEPGLALPAESREEAERRVRDGWPPQKHQDILKAFPFDRIVLRDPQVPAEQERKSLRAELLEEANSLVNGDRNNAYGPPHQDFQRTADMLTAMGFRFGDYRDGDDARIEAHHVAMILAAVKLSRLAWSPDKRDSWVDLAGYAACGHEAYELTKEAG